MQFSSLYRVAHKKRLLTYTPYAAQTFFVRALSSLETYIFKDFLKKDLLPQ